jgi:serine/threonine-protein kinase
MIGETFGSYRVTEKLGEGGMGAVYLAEHTLIGRKVAIKVLLPEHSRKQDLVDRFFNEAKTAASLNHPALVDVFDFGVHPSGSAYLVMDFLDGESLGNRLARVAPLPVDQAVDLARQVARGMEAAHSRGIVHRDLKPDNIFLVPDAEDPTRDQVKILDFGIAKLLGAPSASKGATSTGMVLGTPLYMAPEQCRGTGTVDHRADVYSLGCILYYMLCGRPPFAYEGVGEILGAHLHEAVTPPRAINPALPPALDAVVLKALAKNPAERYQTMADLAADLARLPSVDQPATPLPSTLKLPAAPGPTTFSEAAAALPAVAAPSPAPARRRLLVPVAVAFAAGLVLGGVALLRARPTVNGSGDRRPGPATGSGERRPGPATGDRLPGSGPTAASAPTASSGGAASPAAATPPATAPSAATAGAQEATPPSATGKETATAQEPAATGKEAAATGKEPSTDRRRDRRPSLRRDAVDAYSLGITHLARGDEIEALQAFRDYLRGSGQPPARRAEAERYAIDLARKFGEVVVVCKAPGAAVSLDGKVVGHCPLPRNLFMRPGPHDIAVDKEGYQSLRRRLQVAAGQRTAVIFGLEQ